jgi:hypothetical protein
VDALKGAAEKSGYPTKDVTLHELRNAFPEITVRGIISGKKIVGRSSSNPCWYRLARLSMLEVSLCRITSKKIARCLERQVNSPETRDRSNPTAEAEIRFLRLWTRRARTTLFLSFISPPICRQNCQKCQGCRKEWSHRNRSLNIDSLIQSDYDGSTCDEVTHFRMERMWVMFP